MDLDAACPVCGVGPLRVDHFDGAVIVDCAACGEWVLCEPDPLREFFERLIRAEG